MPGYFNGHHVQDHASFSFLYYLYLRRINTLRVTSLEWLLCDGLYSHRPDQLVDILTASPHRIDIKKSRVSARESEEIKCCEYGVIDQQ